MILEEGMKVIAFVGFPASGKSVASEIAARMNIPVVVMGDVIREEVSRSGLPLSDENLGSMGDELRRKEGMDAIARRCVPGIKNLEADVVMVDGVRGIAEVSSFREEFGDDFLLVGVEASERTRYERMVSRARSDTLESFEEFRKRDEREERWGLEHAMRAADITLVNEGSLDDFKVKIKDLLETGKAMSCFISKL